MLQQKETPASLAKPGLQKTVRLDDLNTSGVSQSPHISQALSALLFYQDRGRYNVTFGGVPIVVGSADPETDLARALLERGLTGTVTIRDGKTGIARTFIDIEMAAAHRTVETGSAPRFRRLTCAERAPAGARRST